MTEIPASDSALLCALSDLIGPPGFEDQVVDWLLARVEPLAQRVVRDPLGNLLVWMAAPASEDAPTLMVDCHTDEIGFVVAHISDDGFLAIRPLGGWDPRVVPAHPITISTRSGAQVRGAIGFKPPHIQTAEERTKVLPIETLRVDVGAASRAEAEDIGLRIGDPAVIHVPCAPLGPESAEPEVLIGKAFDNRAGCAAALRLIERFAAQPVANARVAFSFSAAEEVGLRGARTAAYTIAPDFALALEGTTAGDVPGVAADVCPTRQRQGAAISVVDRSMVVPRRLVAYAERIAAAQGIAHQLKLPSSGGTDAGAIHLTRGGVPSMVVSSPCRYIHSAVSTIRLEDFRAVVDLSEAIVRGVVDELFAS